MGGRTLSTERPRGRRTGGGEFELGTSKVFSSAALPNFFVVEWMMLAGVATSRHVDLAQPGQNGASDPAIRAAHGKIHSGSFVDEMPEEDVTPVAQ